MVAQAGQSGAGRKFEVPVGADVKLVTNADARADERTFVIVGLQPLEYLVADERKLEAADLELAADGVHPEKEARILLGHPVTVLGADEPMLDLIVRTDGPGVVVGRESQRGMLPDGHLGPDIRSRGSPVKQIGLHSHLLRRRSGPAAHGQKKRRKDLLIHIHRHTN